MSGSALEPLAESYYDLRWHFDPVAASDAGLSSYDDRLGSFTSDMVREYAAALRAMMAALEHLEVTDLDDEIDRTALLNEIRFLVHRFTSERPHVRDPGFWLSHLFEGLYQTLFLRDRPRANRVRSARDRLQAVPAFLEAARSTLAQCPPVLTELAVDLARSGTALIDEIERDFGAADASGLQEVAGAARDAIRAFAAELRDRMAQDADASFAIGPQAFAFRLQFQHALQASATELARYGARLMEEVERDLVRMAAELSPGTAWPDLMDRLRDDVPAAGSVVATYDSVMRRARAFVLECELVPVPRGALEVVATPEFLRPLVPFAAYQAPGAFATDRTGWFYVTVPDAEPEGTTGSRAHDHCLHDIPSTAVHEAYPGHHLQFLNAQGQPRLVRQLVATPVTVEGWALYAEELMAEAGFYATAEERFFQRVALLWRALRVVLDIGLHAGGLAFEDAVDMLVDRIHLDRRNAEAEVRRYCATPTYQLAYAAGRRELLALREACRAGEDPRSLRTFHDSVLRYGGLPVSLMRWGMGVV